MRPDQTRLDSGAKTDFFIIFKIKYFEQTLRSSMKFMRDWTRLGLTRLETRLARLDWARLEYALKKTRQSLDEVNHRTRSYKVRLD